MYSQADLYEEVQSRYLGLEPKSPEGVSKNRLIEFVMRNHDDIKGADREFALFCIQRAISDSVDRYFREIDKSEKDDDSSTQTSLDGFDRVQPRYVIQRQGKSAIVAIYQMSDEEIRSKAEKLQTNAQGLNAHATELLKFIRLRTAGKIGISR